MNLNRPALLLRRGAAIVYSLLLTACVSQPVAIQIQDNSQHNAALRQLDSWEISGRLNIRQGNQSDTLRLQWTQDSRAFDINLSSSTLGIGVAHLYGNDEQTILEKSGEEPVRLSDLDELSAAYLGYEFPASYLQWWIKGMAVPGLKGNSTGNENGLIASMTQTAASGQQWLLSYDRYQQVDSLALPGRIRLQSQGIRLTFLNINWTLDSADE